MLYPLSYGGPGRSRLYQRRQADPTSTGAALTPVAAVVPADARAVVRSAIAAPGPG